MIVKELIVGYTLDFVNRQFLYPFDILKFFFRTESFKTSLYHSDGHIKIAVAVSVELVKPHFAL